VNDPEPPASQPPKLKVGIIGCGSHGQGHIKGYSEIPQAAVVAVSDLAPEKTREASLAYDVGHHYTDYREMLDRHELDIVSLALPPAANLDATVASLEAGAHVLISKPLAMNVGQAKQMIEASERCGKRLSMGLQNRFSPEARALRRFLSEGKLRHVYHTRIWHGHQMHIPPTPTMYRRELAGGGVVFHTTVHLLDVILWVLGNPRPVRVSASSYQKLGKMKTPRVSWGGTAEDCDIEDFNVGLVHFEDGSTMTIESNWMMHPRLRPSGAELLGDWGVASLRPLKIELEEGNDIVDVTPDTDDDRPGSVYEDFCNSILEDRPPTVRPNEMLDVQRILDALYEAADTAKEIQIRD
jgi:predicted dehydrogenase